MGRKGNMRSFKRGISLGPLLLVVLLVLGQTILADGHTSRLDRRLNNHTRRQRLGLELEASVIQAEEDELEYQYAGERIRKQLGLDLDAGLGLDALVGISSSTSSAESSTSSTSEVISASSSITESSAVTTSSAASSESTSAAAESTSASAKSTLDLSSGVATSTSTSASSSAQESTAEPTSTIAAISTESPASTSLETTNASLDKLTSTSESPSTSTTDTSAQPMTTAEQVTSVDVAGNSVTKFSSFTSCSSNHLSNLRFSLFSFTSTFQVAFNLNSTSNFQFDLLFHLNKFSPDTWNIPSPIIFANARAIPPSLVEMRWKHKRQDAGQENGDPNPESILSEGSPNSTSDTSSSSSSEIPIADSLTAIASDPATSTVAASTPDTTTAPITTDSPVTDAATSAPPPDATSDVSATTTSDAPLLGITVSVSSETPTATSDVATTSQDTIAEPTTTSVEGISSQPLLDTSSAISLISQPSPATTLSEETVVSSLPETTALSTDSAASTTDFVSSPTSTESAFVPVTSTSEESSQVTSSAALPSTSLDSIAVESPTATSTNADSAHSPWTTTEVSSSTTVSEDDTQSSTVLPSGSTSLEPSTTANGSEPATSSGVSVSSTATLSDEESITASATATSTNSWGSTIPTDAISSFGNATYTPAVNGTGVSTFNPTSTSTDWDTASETASATSSYNYSSSSTTDEAYTPTQTWLIGFTQISSTDTWTSDEPTTTPTKTGTKTTFTTSTPSVATIPSSMPTLIVPANSVANNAKAGSGETDDPIQDKTLIAILLSADYYPWWFVVNSSDATSQLFNTFPTLISNALEIDGGDVQTYGLQVYQPAAWDGDKTSLLTQYMSYIPTKYFDTLNAYIKTSSSPLYNQTGIEGALAAQINTAFPLAASSETAPTSSTTTGGSSASNRKRNIIIGVCVTVGGLLWIALVYWIYQRVKKSNDKAVHKRLSEHMSVFGDHRPMSEVYAQSNWNTHSNDNSMRRVSMVPSIAASEIDDRPSSFYASPFENDRSARDRDQQRFDEIHNRQSYGTSAPSNYSGQGSGSRSPIDGNYGPSVFGTSWFQNPHQQQSQGRSRISQNPFEDMATRSYLGSSSHGHGVGAKRRSAVGKPVSKALISNPTLQGNSLEFRDYGTLHE
ncbi:uncharacterized protein L201_002147 [Kwoniella dendrophila CBS 6074]|uniref:Mid2 domain-containing protein n=1 Tax=Kwoniella dendrophila CBS 6074 TaxID=1295534 RepID=A0AAX4JQX7_9TREE